MKKLKIYQKSLELVVCIYKLIKNNQDLKRDYSLCDQLKRAAVSIVLNITEGYGKGVKHYRSYLKISVGSTNEVIAILEIIKLIYKIQTQELQNQYEILAKQISSFSNSFRITS